MYPTHFWHSDEPLITVKPTVCVITITTVLFINVPWVSWASFLYIFLNEVYFLLAIFLFHFSTLSMFELSQH